jgi:hypothetical protein
LNIRALLPISLERLIKILPILALSLCLPAMAQEQNGWQFDSRRADSTVSKTDARQIYAVLLEMFDHWNAHDIEDIWRCTGNHPNSLSLWIPSSLTAGSNSTIPTLNIALPTHCAARNPDSAPAQVSHPEASVSDIELLKKERLRGCTNQSRAEKN